MVANFGLAIKRPFTDIKVLIIGVILMLVATLGASLQESGLIIGSGFAWFMIVSFIIGFFVQGFFLECARTASKKKFKMPQWDKWGQKWLHGLTYMVIAILYMIPAIIFFIIGVFRMIAAAGGIENIEQVIASKFLEGDLSILGAGLAWWIIGGILAILAMYVLYSAATNYAQKYRFSDAFGCKVCKKAFTGDYFATFVVIMIYVIVVTIVLNLIPYIGPAVAGFISGVTALTAFGEIYPKIK